MSPLARLVTTVFLSLAASVSGAQSWNPHADLIFVRGQIVTVDEHFSIHEAVAIKDDRIVAVGTAEEVLAHRGETTQVVELEGKVVIPGIQDSHIHFLGLGHDVNYQAELTFAKNAEDILQAVRDLKARLESKPGDWLVGERWDQYKYPKMVTRWELDEVAPENPVLLNRVYRGIAVNTAVFRLMGIDDERPETWPDWWEKDPEDFTFEDRIYREKKTLTIDGKSREVNVPTGVFLGRKGSRLVTAREPQRSFEEDVESVRLGVEEMLRLGVTSIVDPSSRMGHHMRVYQEAHNQGLLKMRISAVYEGTFFTEPPEEIDQHFDRLKINNLGDPFLRWRGAKFYADGGVGTRSAWVSEPFFQWKALEGKENFGNPVVADNALREAQYRATLKHGWDLHTHNCGDQAMRQTVDLYMKLMDEIREKRPDADLRWSVIHAYLPIEPKTRVLEDMKRYGIIAVPNPVFNWQQGFAFNSNLSAERMERHQPFRTYMESGVMMASGSDYGVTSHNPWLGFYALLTRIDQTTGEVYGPEETIGIADALRSYTLNGAYLTYEEDFKGSLEVGKVADLVVLDLQDIQELESNPELCFEMPEKVLMTLVDGKVQYRKADFQPTP
jgi:predicted amidohydrolase YtcJ